MLSRSKQTFFAWKLKFQQVGRSERPSLLHLHPAEQLEVVSLDVFSGCFWLFQPETLWPGCRPESYGKISWSFRRRIRGVCPRWWESETCSRSPVTDEKGEEERAAAQLSRGIQTCLLWRCFNKESRDCEIAWSYCCTHSRASVSQPPITIQRLKLLEQKCLFSPNKIVNY